MDPAKSIKKLTELEISSENLLYDVQRLYEETLAESQAVSGILEYGNNAIISIPNPKTIANQAIKIPETETAISKLSETKPASPKNASSDPKRLILDEKRKLIESFNSLKSFSNEAGLAFPDNRFAELSKEADDFIASNNLSQARTALDELSKINSDLNNALLEKADEKIDEAQSSIEGFYSLLDGINEKAFLLEKSLLDLNSNENYLPSTSIERIRNLKESANSPDIEELKKSLKAFESLKAKDIRKALAIFNDASSKLKNAKLKLERIDKEFSDDLNEIKLDSLSFYNKAVTKANAMPIPALVSEYLSEAKEYFDKEKYSKSLSNSLEAISLMSLSSTQEIEIPLSVYPLVAVIAIVLYVRHKRSKVQKPVPVAIEKILP